MSIVFITIVLLAFIFLKRKNRKSALGIIALTIIVIASGSIIYLNIAQPAVKPSIGTTKQLDFTVSASSDCLRFLNSSVPTLYVPFTIPANGNWKLIINCTKMAAGSNGWTDVYIYKGYWDEGTNHICKAVDLYPIISDIKSADFEIKTNQPYTQIFNSSTQENYTIFMVIPPGGPSTFHVTLKPV